MGTVNNETDKTLKQLSNNCMKASVIENEYNKLENSQPQIKKNVYTENKIKIDEIKHIQSDNSVR